MCYAWGNRSVDQLHARIVRDGTTEVYVAVHVNELTDQLIAGLERWMRDVDADPDLARTVYPKAKKLYGNLSTDVMDAAVRGSQDEGA